MFKKVIKKLEDKILAQANTKAYEIIKEAKVQKERILKESTLLRAIKHEANEIKYQTQKDCEKIRAKNSSLTTIFKYFKVSYWGNDLWLVGDIETHKFGILNKNGDLIVPFIYDFMEQCEEVGTGKKYISVSKNYRYGALNQDFTDWIEPKYQEQFLFWEGLAYIKFNNKYGYINHDEEVVIPIIYDKADNFYDGKAKVVLNGKNIIIDRY